nr:transposase family protein [Chthonobacter rhizosphaerae]
MSVRSAAVRAQCPSCGTWSSRVQSSYRRTASDLPLSGRAASLAERVRRFHCDGAQRTRRIFAERHGEEILAPFARRTGRLEIVVHHLGLALGGGPGAGFARRLQVPVSNDTLIRVVRRRATAKAYAPPRAVGIDDFAFRRNCRYGTIVVDLENRGS